MRSDYGPPWSDLPGEERKRSQTYGYYTYPSRPSEWWIAALVVYYGYYIINPGCLTFEVGGACFETVADHVDRLICSQVRYHVPVWGVRFPSQCCEHTLFIGCLDIFLTICSLRMLLGDCLICIFAPF